MYLLNPNSIHLWHSYKSSLTLHLQEILFSFFLHFSYVPYVSVTYDAVSTIIHTSYWHFFSFLYQFSIAQHIFHCCSHLLPLIQFSCLITLRDGRGMMMERDDDGEGWRWKGMTIFNPSQQKDDDEGCAKNDKNMKEGSPGAYVDDWVRCGHICLVPVFFRTALPISGSLALEMEWAAITWCGWGKLFKRRSNYWSQGTSTIGRTSRATSSKIRLNLYQYLLFLQNYIMKQSYSSYWLLSTLNIGLT